MKSQFKASTLCASSALLVLGGFMSINLAGCGGGGGNGGGGFASPTATPAAQNITFRLVRQSSGGPSGDMAVSNGGTVKLTSATGNALTATANSSGIASIPSVPPGVYNVEFTVRDANGTALSTTQSTITITRASGQTYLLIQDQGAGSTTGFSVSGVIRLNPGTAPEPTPTATATATGTPVATATASATATGTPTATATATSTPNPFQFSTCTTSSEVVTGSLLIEAIDLDTAKGRPIIAQVRRSSTVSNGSYTILLPYKPAAFQIRVSQFDTSGARYAGFSPLSNFNGVNAVTNLNICVNENGVAPQIPVSPTATPTATRTPTPIPTTTTTDPNVPIG